MRALTIRPGEADSLALVDIDEPAPDEGEVLVDAVSVGLCGTDAEIVARWFPLGMSRRTIVVDPMRAFGRPIVVDGGVPTEVLSQAVEIEGSPERVSKLYEVPLAAVRDSVAFQQQLAA